MTETYRGPTGLEDIEQDASTATVELERRADAILMAAELPDESRPLRQAVREDAGMVRDWGRDQTDRLRGAVEAEPMKATLYALGIGVVIGLLAAR